MKQSELFIEFVCPKCKQSITWARPSTTVYCKRCDRWISYKQLTAVNPAKMDPEKTQLLLF